MLSHIRRSCVLFTAVFLLPLACHGSRHILQASATAPAPPPAQVITLTTRNSRFLPSSFHVKKGAHVELRITAEDRQHGFRINLHPDDGGHKGQVGLLFVSPKNCWKIPKGQTVSIQFVAVEEGSYAFRCCTLCGLGHFGMKGQIIVDP